MKNINWAKFLFFIFCNSSVFAQILDDSTQIVYSLQTVRVLSQHNIFVNDTLGIHPDSTLRDFFLTDKLQKSGGKIQDLGNLGTASQSVLFPERKNSALEYGNRVFNLYKIPNDSVAYFHTFSPFTNLNYLQNNNGTVRLRFTQSQNIKPNLNFTIDINRLASSKQIESGSVREARLIDSWNFVFSSNFHSKNKKYFLLSNLNHFNHKQIEQGGVAVLDSNFRLSEVNQNAALISTASSREFSTAYFLFHQYKLAGGLDVFNEIQFEVNKYNFQDLDFSNNAKSGFYPMPIDSSLAFSDTLAYINRNLIFKTKQGFKGYYKGFLMNVYLKTQNFSVKDSVFKKQFSRTDLLIGGEINLVGSSKFLKVVSEINFNQGGLFLQGDFRYKNFITQYRLTNLPVDYAFRRIHLFGYNFDNDSFKNQTIQFLSSKFNFKYKNLLLAPYFTSNIVSNFLYFDINSVPSQNTNGIFSVFSMGMNGRYSFKKMLFSNDFTLNATTNSFLFPIPKIINSSTFTYDWELKDNFTLKVGVRGYFKSAYFGNAYNPLIQQFYLQNDHKIAGKFSGDLFSSFLVKKVKVAVIYSYFNQRGNSAGKYIETTPNYVSMRSSFNIAFNWPLFD